LNPNFAFGRHSGYNATMTLRFQFSLRALMAAVAIAALCLGAWQGYKARIAEFVRAESAQVGQPIRLSRRFRRSRARRFLVAILAISVALRAQSPNLRLACHRRPAYAGNDLSLTYVVPPPNLARQHNPRYVFIPEHRSYRSRFLAEA
jgi:hypothetical protein